MAVIKERRNFQIGNIGVVKISDAAERAAVSAMNNADKLLNMAFKGAEREAKEAGVDLAESLNVQNIRTINPKTGFVKILETSWLAIGKRNCGYPVGGAGVGMGSKSGTGGSSVI